MSLTVTSADGVQSVPSRQYAFQFAEMLHSASRANPEVPSKFDVFLQDLMETHHFNVCSVCLDLVMSNFVRAVGTVAASSANKSPIGDVLLRLLLAPAAAIRFKRFFLLKH